MSGIMQMLLGGAEGRVQAATTISANTQNYVVNTAKASGYAAGRTDFTLTINSGVYVGSSSTGGIGMDVDTSWAAGDTVTIVNNGFIVGCGGAGGRGGDNTGPVPLANGTPGSVGGAALRVQRATSINNLGTIGGGGGGGGGGAFGFTFAPKQPDVTYGGGGGGGGRGSSGGGGGAGGTTAVMNGGTPGTAGTTSAAGPGGGATGAGGPGASGGSFGASGGTGTGSPNGYVGGSGGGGGNCTTSGSNANITWIATGTRNGTIG